LHQYGIIENARFLLIHPAYTATAMMQHFLHSIALLNLSQCTCKYMYLHE